MQKLKHQEKMHTLSGAIALSAHPHLSKKSAFFAQKGLFFTAENQGKGSFTNIRNDDGYPSSDTLCKCHHGEHAVCFVETQ